MTDPTCIIEERGQACGRPCWDQAYMCQLHGRWLIEELDKVPGIVSEMDVVRTRQVAGTERVGTVATKDVPLPYDARVSTVEDALVNSLTTWARLIAEERGVDEPEPHGAPDGPRCEAGIGCKHDSCAAIRAQLAETPAAAAARWLTGQIPWVRHQPAADEFYADVRGRIRAGEQLVDKRAPRLYLGPCDEEIDGDGSPLEQPCERDIYAPIGAAVVTCPVCMAQHDVEQRRAVILARAANHRASAGDISAFCYSMLGDYVTTAMIRGYFRMEKLQRHGTVRDRRGRTVPAYKIGEVVELVRELSMKPDDLCAAMKIAREIEGEDRKALQERRELANSA